jgi:glycosyltransferase involved in cell wall biosynthesis
MTDPAPVASVVIIGRNEGARLIRCINSVNVMRDPGGPVEVIYVDSASTDDSRERAAELGAKVILVHTDRPSAATGRNAGWQAARAPIVLFLDGDTILNPDFVADCLSEFADPQVAVVWGHRREIHPEASIYNRVLDLDWVYPPGPTEFCGGDALMRRDVLEQLGGMDATLIAGEEPELCTRIRACNYTILHVDRQMTGHDLAMTRWRQYWRRAFRAGHAYAEVAQRFMSTDTPLWEREVKRNLVHGLALLLVPLGGIILSLLLQSWLPVVGVLLLLSALIGRTALRVGRKDRNPLTRLLYAVHSHLQQIPILFGQLGYRLGQRQGRQRGLIEYH